MKRPHVTVICPIHPDRKTDNIFAQFEKQDYKRCDLLVSPDANNIGTKRNLLVSKAKGDIIVHMDDDDIYAKDWISQSVAFLLANREVMITGLGAAHFRHGDSLYKWQNPTSQRYVCEATMAYWKKIHGGSKVFGDTSFGEGHNFLKGNGKIMPHGYIQGFEAQITGNNTASHLSLSGMQKIS